MRRLTMAEALRVYFLGFYAVSVIILLVRVLPAAARATPERRVEGLRRYLPWVFLPVDFLVPPILILLRAGEIQVEWLGVRLSGLILSLYAAGMLLWAAATMGRLLVPQAIVSHDHALVTLGPYRFLRHPTYSGDLALWLASALGTVNVLLLVLWPIIVIGVSIAARLEEQLLESKFGDAYRNYSRRVRRFIPTLRG